MGRLSYIIRVGPKCPPKSAERGAPPQERGGSASREAEPGAPRAARAVPPPGAGQSPCSRASAGSAALPTPGFGPRETGFRLEGGKDTFLLS